MVKCKVSVFTAFFLLSIIGKVPILHPNLPVIPVVQMPIQGPIYRDLFIRGAWGAQAPVFLDLCSSTPGFSRSTMGSSTYYVITFEGGGGHKMMMVDDVREVDLSK